MFNIEQIRLFLHDRNAQKVGQETGIHPNTVREIRKNPDANPTYRVVKTLSDYFEAPTHGKPD